MGEEWEFPLLYSRFQFGPVLLNVQMSLIVLESALKFDNKYTTVFTEHERISKPTFPPKVNAKRTWWFVSRVESDIAL